MNQQLEDMIKEATEAQDESQNAEEQLSMPKWLGEWVYFVFINGTIVWGLFWYAVCFIMNSGKKLKSD